jgi:hypothetical protein
LALLLASGEQSRIAYRQALRAVLGPTPTL